MKYWWTLGCFPTGLSVPFRLGEFLSLYQQQHVPCEVEEWLLCFVKQPYDELTSAVTRVLQFLEASPPTERSRGYTCTEASVTPMLPALRALNEHLGVNVPAFGLRCAAGEEALRATMLDALYDYACALRTHGSTPHRRLACVDMTQQQPLDVSSKAAAFLSQTRVRQRSLAECDASNGHSTADGSQHSVPAAAAIAASTACVTAGSGMTLPPCETTALADEQVSRQAASHAHLAFAEHAALSTRQQVASHVDAALRPPPYTALDERALIRFCTSVADACAQRQHVREAYSLLAELLYFAHDDAVRAVVHSNAAAAALLCGDLHNAEFHAREAALMLSDVSADTDTAGADACAGLQGGVSHVYDHTSRAVASRCGGCSDAAVVAADAVCGGNKCSSKVVDDKSVDDRRPMPARQRASVRAYTLWSTAVAYKDDYASAMRIADDALTLWPAEVSLQALRARLGALHDDALSRRARACAAPLSCMHLTQRPLAQQQRDGLLHGSGLSFDNEFDWTVFKNRLYPSKMHPRNNELGSVFRRVGNVAGYISTSYSSEPI